MKLSKKGEYGIRALVDLSIAQEAGHLLVPIAALSEAQGISQRFLENILGELRETGWLATTRGRAGGYSLRIPADRLRLGDVIRRLDGPLAPVGCVSQTAYERCNCPDEAHCGLRLIMQQVRDAISGVLDQTTLAQLAAQTLATYQRDRLIPPILKQLSDEESPSAENAAARLEPEFSI